MPEADFERIKRYVRYADRQQRIRRRPHENWWYVYGLFWLVTLVLLVSWMADNYVSAGRWWMLAMMAAFVAFHILAVWGIYRLSRTHWFCPTDAIERLRYDRDQPAAGQICCAIRSYIPFMGGMGPFKTNDPRRPYMRPMYKVLEVGADRTLTLQLIRPSDQMSSGEVFNDVPFYEVEAIES